MWGSTNRALAAAGTTLAVVVGGCAPGNGPGGGAGPGLR